MGKIITRLLQLSRIEVANDDLIPIEDVSAPKTKAISISELKKVMVDTLYPIGSVYVNASNATNPGTLLGYGTWIAHGTGRVNVGIDPSQTEFDAIGEIGGHKLMQAHKHRLRLDRSANDGGWLPANSTSVNAINAGTAAPTTAESGKFTDRAGTEWVSAAVMENTGGGNAENLQPYIVVYSWKRTA